ncbi:MAG TPA: polysaccharide deacetylase family protein [Jatrophihabitantaceae bacterium]|nr:polysaccharide deacetylase family protein [Jatrophihabitantaceae bacterium]
MTEVVPVLLYHAVADCASSWIGDFTVRPADFERHLELIVESGRTPITMSALVDGFTGRAALPAAPVAITFDDGFADTAETAAPMLAERDMVATVYVTSGFVQRGASPGGDRMLDWHRVRELDTLGHEVAAHSHTHPQLDLLGAGESLDEIVRSKQLVEDAVGHGVRSFAYPHGYHTPRVRAQVAGAGFDSACAVRNALTHPGDHRLALARLMLTARTTTDDVTRWLAGHGAPAAAELDPLRTKAWRLYRRARSRTQR